MLTCFVFLFVYLLDFLSLLLLLFLGFVVSSFACFVRRLVRMKPCLTHESRWVKYKRDCAAIATWLSVILPLYDELVTLSP